MTQHTRRLTACLALFLIVGLTGCPFSPEKDKPNVKPESQFKANTSPGNILDNLIQAYLAGDIEIFSDLLDYDYSFIFSEEDQGQPGTPTSLNKTDEIAIQTNMFSDLVDKLELEFEYDESLLAFDEELSTLADSLWLLEVNNVQLTLKGRLPGQPDMTPITWQLDNGSQKFWFHKASPEGPSGDPLDPESHLPLWTIRRWEETTISGTK